MRSFPSASRRRVTAAVAVVALAAGVTASPNAVADDHLKHRRHQVKHQIRNAGADLDESSAAMRRATAALAGARSRLADARDELHGARSRLYDARVLDRQMQAALAAAEDRLAQAEADLAAGAQDREDQRQTTADMVTSIYEQGDPRLAALGAILNSRTAADVTRQAEAHLVAVNKQDRTYDDLQASEVLLRVRARNVRQAKVEVAAKRAAAAAHLVTMKKLTEQARTAKAKVLVSVQEREKATEQARRARQHDLQQLRRLKARERHIQSLIQAAVRRAQAQAAAAQRHNAPAPGYHGSTGGLLDMPVHNSYVTSPYGWRIHPIYGYWGLHDGDDFHAPCGVPLYAAGSGYVMSEYYSSVWGNRLYLNLGSVNGKNVTVIYNHLSSYRVGSGARVSRGEVVGYAGTTGWSTACHLHFTVMVNGAAVDPTPWLS